MGLHAMHLALVGEEQQVGVSSRVHHVIYHIVFTQFRGFHSPSATALDTVGGGQHRLQISAVADRNDQLVIGDQVLEREVTFVGDDP